MSEERGEQDCVGGVSWMFSPLQVKNELKNGHKAQKKGCHSNKSLRPGTS